MAGLSHGGHERRPDWFWDLYSTCYDAIYGLMPYRKLLWDTYEALELEPGMRVLDAGCGTGNLELFIAEKDPPPIEIDGVDFSRSMLARARRKCGGLGSVRFAQTDLSEDLPFEADTFDRIVSINVLYALPDRGHTMREFLRVLKPEGRLVLTSPSPEFSWVPLALDHFRRVRNIWGLGRQTLKVLDSLRLLATTAFGAIVLNRFVIERRESRGTYRSLDENGLRHLLEEHRRDGLGHYDIGTAFGEQNLLATAVKLTSSPVAT